MHPKKFSGDMNSNQRPNNFREKDKKLDMALLNQEFFKTKLSEKEFYEKCKPWIDNQYEKFGLLTIKLLEAIIVRNFNAYQFLKLLMNTKIKTKLKLVDYGEEKDFYSYIFQIMKTQKESVTIEALKLLGYMTSECLQSISQQTQLDIVQSLKYLTSPEIKNLNLVRLSLNCIGNIFTHSNFKISDEENELFNNLYELLKNLQTVQALEDQNNVRLLAAILRVMNSLFIDMKTLPQNINDFLMGQIIKYLYLGTTFFPLPNPSAFCTINDASSDSGFYTSSSDLSDIEESEERQSFFSERFTDRKKHEEVCSKIRNYCAACLASIFRQNTKLISQYITTLLPCKVFTKEVMKFITNTKEPMILSKEPLSEVKKRKQIQLIELKNDFNEPNLLYLLIFEDSTKIRLSVSKAICSILDGYHNDKILLTIDGEKLEKTKIDPFKSISHQIYQIFKNLSLSVILGIFLETDEGFVNHLLRLAATMISHQSYEKVGFLTIDHLITNILVKILPKYTHHTIYLSCIACFSSLANGKTKFKNFENLALNDKFDIIKALFTSIKESIEMVATHKEVKNVKHDKIADSTILLESIIALSKFPKHYVENILDSADSLLFVAEKVQHLDRKFSNVTFKLIEETMKYISSDKDFENNDEMESAPKAQVTQEPKFKAVNKIKQFHNFLEKLFSSIFKQSNVEFLEYVLNILYYLDELDWVDYYKETRERLIGLITKLNTAPGLKHSLLRMLGKICTFSIFIDQVEFPKLVYQALKSNINEKNNNIMVKNSWVLANLSANSPKFDLFSVEENRDILSMILIYCNSPKEKLVSNGYRALGYFIYNNSDKILYQIVGEKAPQCEEILKSLRDVYLKSFDSFSVKVCWNVCVSFSNILKGFKPEFMKVFFNEEILQNMKSILINKNNFKTQIHCVEMLTLAFERYPNNTCFTKLAEDLSNIYFVADEGEFDINELRYLPQLRVNINKLILKLLDSRDILKNPGDVVDILNNIPHKFLKVLFDQLEVIYKENESKIREKWEEDKGISSKKEDKAKDFDEAPVKGQESQGKIVVSWKKLRSSEGAPLYEYLQKVQKLTTSIVALIDSLDDISVPFSAYESLQHLASIDLGSKDEAITILLHSFQFRN